MTGKDGKIAAGDSVTGPSGVWQTRYLQVLLMFVGLGMAFALRICMSIAIVAMTDCEGYEWNSTETGYIQSSFFWGYVVTQIPAGHVAKYRSAKNLVAVGVGVGALFSLVTPLAANGGWVLICVCRVGMGLLQGCLLPCMHTLLASWAPPSERTRLVSLTYAGPFFGSALAYGVSGVLAESPAGWPSIFYVFGGMSILWAIVFFVFGADSPSEHRWISEEEKRYIESRLEKGSGNIGATPWRAIFSSAPVWALVAAHCGQNWGFWVIITQISIYMSAILGFNMSENGFKAALPYLTMLLLMYPASWLSDYALKRGLRRVVLRKTANTVSQWGAGAALLGMSFTGGATSTATLPVVIFVLAVGANVGATSGFQINHIDLSPNNAGILMSITNCIASIIAIIAPIAVGAIVTDESNFSQWRMVFYLSAGIYFVSNWIFLLFGSTELQRWNDTPTSPQSSYGTHSA